MFLMFIFYILAKINILNYLVILQFTNLNNVVAGLRTSVPAFHQPQNSVQIKDEVNLKTRQSIPDYPPVQSTTIQHKPQQQAPTHQHIQSNNQIYATNQNSLTDEQPDFFRTAREQLVNIQIV